MPARIDSRLIVILNDNDMSIAPPVGAMSAYLARLVFDRTYRGLRHVAQDMLAQVLPRLFAGSAQRAEEYARGFMAGAARCSRSWASTTSARSTATISTI